MRDHANPAPRTARRAPHRFHGNCPGSVTSVPDSVCAEKES